jgi:CDP-paratose 2-epimerase
VVNVGGGPDGSLSLLETTEICRELTGHDVEVGGDPETRQGDLRIYVSDCRALERLTDWAPRRPPREILADIYDWIHDEEGLVAAALASA